MWFKKDQRPKNNLAAKIFELRPIFLSDPLSFLKPLSGSKMSTDWLKKNTDRSQPVRIFLIENKFNLSLPLITSVLYQDLINRRTDRVLEV